MQVTAWSEKNLWERIVDRQGQLEGERTHFDDTMEDIIEVFRPGLTDFQESTSSKGSIRNVYDGTPASALRTMSNGLQGALVSPSIVWLKYAMLESELQGADEVNKWLQDCEDHMYQAYRHSNYYPALGPFFRGGLSVGTPVMITEEDVGEGRINCTVPHPRENYLRFNTAGVPIIYHRKFKKTALDALQEFKKIDSKFDVKKFSNALQLALSQGQHGREFTFIQAFYRNDDPIFDDVDGDGKPLRPWVMYYIEMTTETKEPLVSAGYFTRPHTAWRYEYSTDETYARTPAWHCLPDAKSKLAIRKTMIEAAEISVRGRWKASGSLRGKIRLAPGGRTYMDETQMLEPLNDRLNYPVGADMEDRMKADVERWFDVDFFLMLSRLMAQGGSPPTATQIIGMEGEKAVLLGGSIQRIVDDALRPQDDRFWDIEYRAGRLPEAPSIVMEESQGTIETEFIGPLAQAQKKLFSQRRSSDALAAAQPYFEMWPETLHKVKADVAVERILEENGFFQDAIRSEEEYAEIMAAIAQKEQMREAAELGGAVADAVPKLQKATEDGAPLEQLAGVVEG